MTKTMRKFLLSGTVLGILGLTILTQSAQGEDSAEVSVKKCQGCHGIDLNKKAFGKSQPLQNMSEDEIESTLKAYKLGTLNKYGFGSLMKAQVESFSDTQIHELAVQIKESNTSSSTPKQKIPPFVH